MSTNGSVGLVQPRQLTFAEDEPFRLDSGATLGPVTVAYETYGQLNADRTNAILITHALSGSAHAAGYHQPDESKTGWWDDCIGPGKAFDTNKFFIVCSNVLGGCYGSTGPSDPDPATGKPYGMRFPVVTIGGHGACSGSADRSSGHRQPAVCGRRLHGRDAGA